MFSLSPYLHRYLIFMFYFHGNQYDTFVDEKRKSVCPMCVYCKCSYISRLLHLVNSMYHVNCRIVILKVVRKWDVDVHTVQCN